VPPARPKLDPAAMLVFASLARTGGVRSAATALGVPRSTVSRRLAELERQAGAPLVIRTARRFALTELGTLLAQQSDELLTLMDRAEQAMLRSGEEPSGLLRVAAAPVLGEDVLPSIVATLLERHPRLRVELHLAIDYVDLRRAGFDVALRAWPIKDATDVYATRIGTSTTGFWVSPAYAAKHGEPKTPKQLESHDCILLGTSTPERWTLPLGGRQRPFKVRSRIRVDSFRLACALAIRGAGVLRTATVAAQPYVKSGDLVPVLESHWVKTPLYVVHAGPNPPSPKVRAFIALARVMTIDKTSR
jgi:DNA-binding transcriptional LysR family regulator